MSSPDQSTGPGGRLSGGGGSLAIGLVLVAALAVGVAVVASTSPSEVALAGRTPSSESPCTDRSGVCLPPDVCPAQAHPYASQDLDRLRPEVEAMVDGAFYGVGTGLHTIDLELFPGHEQLAAELEQRFGDAVSIRMGTARYCGGP